MSDVAWLCNRCEAKDGSRFENRGFRRECLLCKRSKGVAHHSDVQPSAPSRRVAKPADKGARPEAGQGKVAAKAGGQGAGREKAGDKATADLKKEVRELRAELRAALKGRKEEQEPAAPAETPAAAEEPQGTEHKAGFEFFSAEQLLQQKQQLLQQGAPENHPLVVAAHERWQAKKAADEAVQKPEVRLNKLHRREQDLERQVAKAEGSVRELEAQRAELDGKIAEAQNGLAKKRQEIRDVQEDKRKVTEELTVAQGADPRGRAGTAQSILDQLRGLQCADLGEAVDEWGQVLEPMLRHLYAVRGMQQRVHTEAELEAARAAGAVPPAGPFAGPVWGTETAFPVPSGERMAGGPRPKRRGVAKAAAGADAAPGALVADGTLVIDGIVDGSLEDGVTVVCLLNW